MVITTEALEVSELMQKLQLCVTLGSTPLEVLQLLEMRRGHLGRLFLSDASEGRDKYIRTVLIGTAADLCFVASEVRHIMSNGQRLHTMRQAAGFPTGK